MGFDPFSPISTARLNVLLVPAGRIQPERFEELVKQFQNYKVISLGDIVSNERIAKRPGLFSPTVFAVGSILFDYSTSVGTQWIDSFPFELNRTPQVVIALSEFRKTTTLQSVHQDALKLHEEASDLFENLHRSFCEAVEQDQRPLLHSLVVFDNTNIDASSSEITWLSIDGERQKSGLAHYILSIAASVLDVFDDLARDYKGAVIPSPQLVSQKRNKFSESTIKTKFPPSSRVTTSSQATPVTNSTEEEADGTSVDNTKSANRNRFGLSSPKSATSTDSLPDTSRGRYQILLGTLYLQAGRWPDALRELSEGLNLTRGHVVDTTWHAHALEALLVCMLMFAWANLDFNIPQICYASLEKGHGGRWGPLVAQINGNATGESSVASPHSLAKLIPGLHDAIIALHTNISSTAQEQLPMLMLAELRIRLADMLIAICLRGGSLDKTALDHMVLGAPLQQAKTAQLGPPVVSLRKNVIAKLLTEAAEELPNSLPARSSVDILIAVSSRLSKLGLDRIQAFYLRNLLQKLIPGLVDARKIGAAELGIHPAAALSLQGGAINNRASHVRHGVRSILDLACAAYGLPVVLAGEEDESFVSPNLEKVKQGISQWAEMQWTGDLLVKLELLRICINVCEALPDVEAGLQYSTQLLSMAKPDIALPSGSKAELPHMSQDEQLRILNSVKRTVTAANKLGMPKLRAKYWDDFLVREIELLDLHSNEKLVPHTPQELSMVTGAARDVTKDPFIYNPLAKPRVTNKEPILVAEETVYFSVVLQNPFEFDVEVESISILTEGCDFQPSSHNVVLGHCCSQRFILSGVPMSEGRLRIRGCRAIIKDCYEQDFMILPQAPAIPFLAKQKKAGHSMGSSDAKGRRSDHTLQKSTPGLGPKNLVLSTKVLLVDVIRSQPNISVDHTSLSLSSLMLLEGERRRLEITLKNNSEKASTDLILFTFEDSVTKQVQEALTNKGLTPLEIYELQLQLLENPALKWIPEGAPDERPSLQPRQSRTFTFEIVGKPGLMDGTIQIDYASLGRPRSEVTEKFYTRQIRLPISITVNGSIEIPRCNILPYCGRFLQDQAHIDNTEDVRDEGNKSDGQCLALLDFRNVWPQPITIHLQTIRDAPKNHEQLQWSGNRGISETLQPGHVSRSILIMPRAFVTDPYAPIPTIGAQRQFVVSASKLSIEAEAASREAFWYREELLKNIKASWKEDATGRHGTIDIRRGIRLSARMIEALKVDPVDISFLTREKKMETSKKPTFEEFRPLGTSPLLLNVGTFTKIVVEIHNRSKNKLSLLLRLQPSLRDQPHTIALDLSKRFAWSGMLQRPLHPSLNPGETREVELGITALASGQYEISATVEEIKASKAHLAITGADVISESTAERKIWHARQQCLIDAVPHSTD